MQLENNPIRLEPRMNNILSEPHKSIIVPAQFPINTLNHIIRHHGSDLPNIILRNNPLIQLARALQGRDAFPQVSISKLHQAVIRRLSHLNVFLFADKPQPVQMGLITDRLKAELSTSGGQRVDDLADVVAYDAEPGYFCELFYHSSQSCLGLVGQRVSLVEDDYFETGRVAQGAFGHCDLRELFYLFTDHVDASLVRGVQGQDR